MTPSRRGSGLESASSGGDAGGGGLCSISCSLGKGSYLAGERLTGRVIVRPRPRPRPRPRGEGGTGTGGSGGVKVEELAVSVRGHVKVDPRWIPLPASLTLKSLYRQDGGAQQKRGGEGTERRLSEVDRRLSFPLAARGQESDVNTACIFWTHPLELMVGRTMEEGEEEHFRFSVQLPEELYPTYRGIGIKYYYILSIRARVVPLTADGDQGTNGTAKSAFLAAPRFLRWSSGSTNPSSPATKELHVPFVVLGPGPYPYRHGASTDAVEEGGAAAADLSLSSSGVASFQEVLAPVLSSSTVLCAPPSAQGSERGDGAEALMSAMQVNMVGLQGQSGIQQEREGPYVFSIRSGELKVCKLVLQHLKFEPGDVVLGNFDFRGAGCLCWSVSAALEVAEINKCAAIERSEKDAVVHRQVIDTYHRLTACSSTCSLALSLPIGASLSMDTPFAAVHWQIMIQFTVLPKEIDPLVTPGNLKDARCSQLRWDVPIQVIPPQAPAHQSDHMESQWTHLRQKRDFVV